MPRYVIWVEFDLHPGARDAFLSAVRENAARSVADEPGCRRFDVLEPQDPAAAVALYEIYDDEAAFRAHLETPHFQRFDRESAAMVKGKTVRAYAVHECAKG